jgi:NADH-quinone oxidoreductase subunit L
MIANMFRDDVILNTSNNFLVNNGLILFLYPLVVGILILIFGGKNESTKRISQLLSTFTIGMAFVYILFTSFAVRGYDVSYSKAFNWISVDGFNVKFMFRFDSLSLLFGLFISFVALFIHIYSIEYMKNDPRVHRFFGYLSLFCASMFALVFSNNLLFTFLGWEGVGVCSWLLISFWYEKNNASVAGKKAFITNRLADVAFLIGMFAILKFSSDGLDYSNFEMLTKGLTSGQATIISLCLFIGAMGKSAQFPFSVWLPDAMAGPTPVSALIHAATMVTSGIFLMTRAWPLLELSAFTSNFIIIIGAFTAIFAATIALVQSDIKKVLAYSTLSQLGIIFTAIGVHAYSGAVFHVFTHAFFKALLFLAAGSVIHSFHKYAHKNELDEQNINNMGGLFKKLPFTGSVFLVGVLAISGIFPFSGFWSKDEILTALYAENKFAYVAVSLASFLTAVYMMRLFAKVFLGKAKSEYDDVKENGLVIKSSLFILAVFSAIAGVANLPTESGKKISDSLERIIPEHHLGINMTVIFSSTIIAIAGLYIGYYLSIKKTSTLKELSGLKKFLFNGWYVDAGLSTSVEKGLKPAGLAVSEVFEPRVFDGFVVLFEKFFDYAGGVTQKAFKRSARTALVVMTVGMFALIAIGVFV